VSEPVDPRPNDKRIKPGKISKSVLQAYAKFLAGELYYCRQRCLLLETKLKILEGRGIIPDGIADDYSQEALMKCKIVEP
jgi:hypothetical protein